MADMVAAAGLELPSLTKDSQTQLHEWIPPYLRVSNPVDNGGAPVRDWRGPKIIQTMLADPNVDLLLCPITGALPSMGNKLCEDLVDAAATTDKPIFVVWGSPVGTEEAYTEDAAREHACPPSAPSPTRSWRPRPTSTTTASSPPTSPRSPTPRCARRPARKKALPLLAPGGHAERSAVRASRSRTPRRCWRPTASRCPRNASPHRPREAAKAAKKIGYPVVMKIVSADIPHKSDLGLVAVGVRDEDDARRTYKRLVATAKKAAPKATVDGVLVAQMVQGIETVAGIAHDDLFGPVVMFGLGGVLVEVLRRRDLPGPALHRRATPRPCSTSCAAPRCCTACGASRPPTAPPWSTCS